MDLDTMLRVANTIANYLSAACLLWIALTVTSIRNRRK